MALRNKSLPGQVPEHADRLSCLWWLRLAADYRVAGAWDGSKQGWGGRGGLGWQCGQYGRQESALPGRGDWQSCHLGRRGIRKVFHRERAVAVTDFFAGYCSDALAGDQDAEEVERVGRGDRDKVGGFVRARGAKGFDCLREGELFAAEAVHEAAPADLAASLQTAEKAKEFAPLWSVRFAGEQIAEEDSIAGKQHAREGFEGGIGAAGLRDRIHLMGRLVLVQ